MSVLMCIKTFSAIHLCWIILLYNFICYADLNLIKIKFSVIMQYLCLAIPEAVKSIAILTKLRSLIARNSFPSNQFILTEHNLKTSNLYKCVHMARLFSALCKDSEIVCNKCKGQKLHQSAIVVFFSSFLLTTAEGKMSVCLSRAV